MYEKISQLANDAQSMAERINQIIDNLKDYDMLRLMKKVDAEIMDLRHSIELARRFCEKDKPSP